MKLSLNIITWLLLVWAFFCRLCFTLELKTAQKDDFFIEFTCVYGLYEDANKVLLVYECTIHWHFRTVHELWNSIILLNFKTSLVIFSPPGASLWRFAYENQYVTHPLQNHLNQFIQKAKQNYFNKVAKKLSYSSTSTKCYWSLLKPLLNDKKIPCIMPLFHNKKYIVDFKEKEILNTFVDEHRSIIPNKSVLPSQLTLLTEN